MALGDCDQGATRLLQLLNLGPTAKSAPAAAALPAAGTTAPSSSSSSSSSSCPSSSCSSCSSSASSSCPSSCSPPERPSDASSPAPSSFAASSACCCASRGDESGGGGGTPSGSAMCRSCAVAYSCTCRETAQKTPTSAALAGSEPCAHVHMGSTVAIPGRSHLQTYMKPPARALAALETHLGVASFDQAGD